MTQREKMLKGELYIANDPELRHLFLTCKKLVRNYNATILETERVAILKQLLGNSDDTTYMEPPIYFDYGIFGIVLVLMFYIFRNKPNLKYLTSLFVLISLGLCNLEYYNFAFTLQSFCQMFAVFAIPLFILYNDKIKPNKNLKYLFYAFYPAHLIIIYLIKIII